MNALARAWGAEHSIQSSSAASAPRACSPSQAAIDLSLAQEAFDDAFKNWSEYTPERLGELAVNWWVARNALREAIRGES